MPKKGMKCWLLGFLACVFFSSAKAQTTLSPALPDSVSNLKAPAGFHYVEKGDTYYRLARLYQVPVDSLQAWNGPNLKLGATIRVKTISNSDEQVLKPVTPGILPKQPVPPAQVTREPETKSNSYTPEKSGVFTAPKTAQRVVVIPFNPALYFSDADADIAWQSKIPKQKVRYVFRQRLAALLSVPGFQTINLLGAGGAGTDDDLNHIYKSLNYSYQDITYSNFKPIAPPKEKGLKAWVKNTKTKVGIQAADEPISVANDERKYYGVQVKNPELLAGLNKTYGTDYYIFLNQFEIFTDYTNCIDRTTQNFLRNFRVHYSIYNASGELQAGNKVLIPYVSNVNDIEIICRENLGKIATRILEDMPRPQAVNEEALSN